MAVELKNIQQQLQIVGVDILNIVRSILASNNKYNTGNLIASLDIKVLREADKVLIMLKALPYFKYVDRQSPSASQRYYSAGRWRKLIPGPPVDSVGKAMASILKNKDELIRKGVTKDLQLLIDSIIIQNNRK